MNLFHRIDDAQCIARARGGVFKQLELYRRNDRIYVKSSGGFLRVLAKWDEVWGTSSPSLNVVDMPDDIPGLSIDSKTEPRWVGK